MLSTHVPCSLHFLVADDGEILGGMAINHSDTKRGHLHSGIAPWNRKQGYGSHMLKLALEICKNMGMDFVHIAPYKNNLGAIKTILNCGGILEREFFENEKWTQIYRINL